QLARQSVPAALHVLGAHDIDAPALQVPRPSHVDSCVFVLPPDGQDAALHTVPAAYLRHAPLPLQVPSPRQLAAPESLQVPAGSGAPDATGVQLPTVPGRLHATHAPLHAALQQTPCAQSPDWHSRPSAHVAP